MSARGPLELRENLLHVICLCLLAHIVHVSLPPPERPRLHIRACTQSPSRTYTRFYISQGNMRIDTHNIFHCKICTSAARSHSHPDTQNTHPSAKEPAAPHCPKVLMHVFKSHFSGGPRPCRAKHTSSPYKCSVKLAALLLSTLYEHSLLVTQDMS